MEKDPVCGMLVDPKQAVAQREYQGKQYYFCSPGCVAKLDQSPQRYVGPAPAPKSDV
jgi:Cu+-exporting ATPase